MKNLSLALLVSILVSGCGRETGSSSSDSDNSSTQTSSYSYEFESNGCKTGKHVFSSREAYCDGLQSESLNKGCAARLRQDDFRFQGCQGNFQRRA